MKFPLFLAATLCVSSGCARSQTPNAQTPAAPVEITEFPLRDNDVWVMVGDSITEQKRYTAYIEAFARARYPKMPFAVVHSGKSGQVFIQGRIRFRDTVAAYKPTLVSVNFGMNDHVKTFAGEDFQDDPKNEPGRFINSVKGINARPLVFSASPLIAPADYGASVELLRDPANAKKQRDRSNPVGRLFADNLKIVAERNGAPFIDQMTPLQTIWAANYPRDFVATLRDGLHAFTQEAITPENIVAKKTILMPFVAPFIGKKAAFAATLPLPDKENLLPKLASLAGTTTPERLEAFRLYARSWVASVDAASPPFVRLSGYSGNVRVLDIIHPNEAGHLHMAAALLKQLKADGLVSEVAIDARTNKLTRARKASVSDISSKGDTVSFKRLDESLPFPIDPRARPAIGVDVQTPLGTPKDLFGLSRYITTVSNLPKGDYEILIDNQSVATVTAEQLGRGLDLGFMDKGPIFEQTQKLWQSVQTNLVDALVKKTPEEIAAVVPKTLPEAQPVEHTWTIRPLKRN